MGASKKNFLAPVIVSLIAVLFLSFLVPQRTLAQTISEIIDFTGDGDLGTLSGPTGIAVDGVGNVYVAGTLNDNAFKITPGGVITEIINATGDGVGHILDRPVGIAVDGSGNVYVTGRDSDNAFMINTLGDVTEIIDATGDGAGKVLDRPEGIAVDGSGNVYVTGVNSDNAFKIVPGVSVAAIIDTTGDGTGSIALETGNWLDRPVGIAVDGSGNVYVAGFLSNNVFKITPTAVITQIMDASGDGSGNTIDQAYAVAVDASENVFVTGYATSNAFKIPPGGPVSLIIDALADGSSFLGAPNGIAVDGSGNVYVSGEFTDNAFMITPGGIITQIIDFDGDGGGNFLESTGGIVVEPSGTAYVTGQNTDNAFKIEPLALSAELADFDGRVDEQDVLLTWRTVSETNNVGFEVQHSRKDGAAWNTIGFVAGHGTTTEAQSYRHGVSGLAPGTHMFRLKQIDVDGSFAYSQQVELTVGVPSTHLLSAAYPNPFNPQARFTLAVEEAQNVVIEVSNTLGQRVAVLHDGVLTGGTTHSFTLDGANWPSGTYLYRVKGETFAESRMVFLLK